MFALSLRDCLLSCQCSQIEIRAQQKDASSIEAAVICCWLAERALPFVVSSWVASIVCCCSFESKSRESKVKTCCQ
jgi:hypothetical protein